MSDVLITVELPQRALTFSVNVPHLGTVQDIKQEIHRVCPGNPRIDGQRLISKGRILDDSESIEALWKSAEEARVVHLAVNTWSWTTLAPEIPNVPSTSETSSTSRTAYLQDLLRQAESTQHAASRRNAAPVLQFPPYLPNFATLPYIIILHHKALRALSPSTPPYPRMPEGHWSTKEFAKEHLISHGYSWQSIFDEEFPPPSPSSEGVTYEITMFCGLPFLQNLTPYATPTLRQQHALNVLSYTFPLLNVLAGPTPTFTPPIPMAPRAAGQRQAPEPRVAAVNVRIPVRAIVTPLILLCIRTLVLLYFFSPARKPIFGFILGIYVLYEAWGAVRGAVFDHVPNGNGANNANGNNGNPADGLGRPVAQDANNNANGGANRAPLARDQRNFNNVRITTNADAVLTRLARVNLDEEERRLNSGGREPGVFRKAYMFIGLFLMTLHPAVWLRRRAALRIREGRLRTEENAREAAETARDSDRESGEAGTNNESESARQAREQLLARYVQRPAWIREYVDRVREGDWVDD